MNKKVPLGKILSIKVCFFICLFGFRRDTEPRCITKIQQQHRLKGKPWIGPPRSASFSKARRVVMLWASAALQVVGPHRFKVYTINAINAAFYGMRVSKKKADTKTTKRRKLWSWNSKGRLLTSQTNRHAGWEEEIWRRANTPQTSHPLLIGGWVVLIGGWLLLIPPDVWCCQRNRGKKFWLSSPRGHGALWGLVRVPAVKLQDVSGRDVASLFRAVALPVNQIL